VASSVGYGSSASFTPAFVNEVGLPTRSVGQAGVARHGRGRFQSRVYLRRLDGNLYGCEKCLAVERASDHAGDLEHPLRVETRCALALPGATRFGAALKFSDHATLMCATAGGEHGGREERDSQGQLPRQRWDFRGCAGETGKEWMVQGRCDEDLASDIGHEPCASYQVRSTR
jgi:hypothetical protein